MELVQAGAARHRGGNADHPRIPLRLLDQGVREDGRVLGRRLGRRLLELLDLLGGVGFRDRDHGLLFGRLPVDDRSRLGRVPLLHPLEATLLGGLEALALDGVDVDDDGPICHERLAERAAERGDVVTVDHSHVRQVELLEEKARRVVGLDRRLHLRPEPLDAAAETERKLRQPFLRRGACFVEAGIETDALEVAGESADVGRDRHAVVVEDDHHRRLQSAGVMERLVSDAAGKRAVADHRDDLAVLPDSLAHRLLQADSVADRGRSVAGAHDVVLGLEDRAEGREALVLADRVEGVLAAGEDLVGIGLVADVPEDLVRGRVEQAVQRDRQLAGAEVGAEVAADLTDRVDDQLADLLRNLLELLVGEPSQVGGRVDRVKQLFLIGHQVCRVWMKSVIRARSSVWASVSASASRALRWD